MSARMSSERAGCPSQFQLDRLSADDLTDIERTRLERHVAGCAACAQGLAQRTRERTQFVPDPRLLARLGADTPSTRRRQLAVWGPVILCAAAALVLVQTRRSDPAAIGRHGMVKGGVAASLLIRRGGEPSPVSEIGAEAIVHPGDQLQATISLPGPRHVAVYSRDGAGEITRYAPVETPMLAMPAGADQLLSNSTILDDVLGRETVAVFACEDDQPDAVLRAHVLAGAPAGCEVVRLSLIKVAP